MRTADLLAPFELQYELRKQFHQHIAEPSLPTCSSPTRIATQYHNHDAGASKTNERTVHTKLTESEIRNS
jgi:hypothetical protein